MADRVPTGRPKRLQAGIISKIRLENFMCHSNLEIDFGDWVNFITGQNGSGKSAILTALCVAFGSRARGTQRANALKDFIKTGCSHALVHVEMKNRGEDAFKAEAYGDLIMIERRISESTSSIVLKNYQGKKVAAKREELQELIVHFNIDVENPCVIMSQDKSREFLHSGNSKDKFKFFFKATLLQQVEDLLIGIQSQLKNANELVAELEKSINPIVKELDELQGKIRSMEHIEEISNQVDLLKKKLAWAWVYSVDKQLQDKSKRIEELKGRIPTCQSRIDQHLRKMEELNDQLTKKKAQIAHMMEKTSEVRRMTDELKQSLSLATKEKLELEEERGRKFNYIQKMAKRVKIFEQQIRDMDEQNIRNTQAEELDMEVKLKEFQAEIDSANVVFQRLRNEEDTLIDQINQAKDEINKIVHEIEEYDKRDRDIRSRIREFQLHQSNKVTAFGGGRVMGLLEVIERQHRKFNRAPIGPIGAHVTLVDGDKWGTAIECAVGKVLNAFIVTDHKDSLLLRACAREANYKHLQIIIYEFSRPRLHIPDHMLPQTHHPTAISVLRSDNPTVLNVLIDVGNAERQVLVKDYDAGKTVAFDQRISNLKEVYTSDGYKMFSRGSVQTILPPMKNTRGGRLSGSYDNKIKTLENEAFEAQNKARQSKGMKRSIDEELQGLHDNLQNAKKRRQDAERVLRSKEFGLRDFKKSYVAESSSTAVSTVDELHVELSKIRDEIHERGNSLEKLQLRLKEADNKANDVKISFENLCESAKVEIGALEEAERELMMIDKDLKDAELKKNHYEGVMSTKVLSQLNGAEAEYQELEHNRRESYKKASIICPESDIETVGGCDGSTPEQLSAHLTRLSQRLQQESRRHPESIEDLRMLYNKKERKILRKQQTYKAFREKLGACHKALDLRWSKFQRNATLLKRQLTWQFNGHLGKKGISGHIKVCYEEKTLSIEVKMPQDASSSSVRDTRGLSGGERSFSTLCFALALHEMTEAPFRAMDEFDVFMDAVSRKISLDAVVDFALGQGSQWIFITPHDISMVKQDERVKKQQMAAPRS
ncbi:structural maintenance of chromosomes protein 6B isoform X1 [Solanum tuberosum]|uniref:structural maintenance of chromosomes protein 6B isoform X1 n=1 Tax=Solanum tuberosum TaxID=4113 RepID=UPI0003D25752|nr:PREDICTED: structural maintenance of chromosomes protein 6B isoform X1 [Solanum tuberosum]